VVLSLQDIGYLTVEDISFLADTKA
jgi:hypothetical protein